MMDKRAKLTEDGLGKRDDVNEPTLLLVSSCVAQLTFVDFLLIFPLVFPIFRWISIIFSLFSK